MNITSNGKRGFSLLTGRQVLCRILVTMSYIILLELSCRTILLDIVIIVFLIIMHYTVQALQDSV